MLNNSPGSKKTTQLFLKFFLLKLFDNNIFNILFIILITLSIFRPLLSFDYPGWADNSTPPVLNMKRFNEISNFTYAENSNGLIYNANVVLMYFLLNKAFVLLDLFIKNISILSFLWVFLPYVFFNIALYFSFNNVFRKKWISLLLTLFYIFSHHGFNRVAAGYSWTTYSMGSGILFLSLFIRYLKEPRFRFILMMSLLSSTAFINIAFFYAVIFCALIYLFFFIIIENLKITNLTKRFFGLFLLPFLIVLINLYWILPTFLMSREVGGNFNDLEQIYSSKTLNFMNSLTFSSNFSSFYAYSEIFKFFNSNIFQIFYFTLLILVFLYGFKNGYDKKFINIFTVCFIVIFALSLGVNFPFLWNFVSLIPGSFMLRSPQGKFFPILQFFLLCLAGFHIKNKKPYFIYFILIMVFLGVCGYFVGRPFSYWGDSTPPEDYRAVVDYLNKPENRYETLAEFPKSMGYLQISWLEDRYVSNPIINSMIYNPIISIRWSDRFVPKFLANVYHTDDLDNIPNVLGEGNVKYILAHKDYTNFPLKHKFDTYGDLKLILGGDNLDLYQINGDLVVPLIYSYYRGLTYERISPVMHTFKGKPGEGVTFNRQHDINLKLYDNGNLERVGYYNCNFSIGDLNFCDILLLKANPLPKQPLDETYKNNWILPEDSSGSYVVYYEPQIYFYIGLIISFLAFIAQVLFLLFAKDGDKNKRMVLN